MKNIILSVFICMLSLNGVFSQEKIEAQEEVVTLNWLPSFKKALKKSKKEKKPVLIYFTGSDWCSPCKVLDKKLFNTEKFKKIADKSLILYKADIPRNRDLISDKVRKENTKLRKKYDQKAFPTLIFVNHRGRVLDIKKGVYVTEYYYPFVEKNIANY